MRYFYLVFLITLVACNEERQEADIHPRPLQILFLGHSSQHHNSYEYAPILQREWTKEGIHITYTEDPNDLNIPYLSLYDGLILYANHDSIAPDQETALLDFVESGKGFIPVHSASFCFRNSDEFVKMTGGQFMEHGTDTFTAEIIDADHPVTEGLIPFSTWDETYVHDKISDDIHVLMERVEEGHREPYTWVKNYGAGRVFYTALGHDHRTWNHPEFLKLLKNGVLWAVKDETRELWQQYHDDLPEFVYREERQIPNYEKRDPPPKYQEPFSPEESKKLIQVPAGFELELFASEPDIVNPVSMAWDEKGRLWVIETVDYPNTIRDRRVGLDRIKICEDTNGDGRADKFTIFADSLNIPTSLVFVNGGVLISQAPEFIFLKDTDGDDVADVREVVMEGWGTWDTHAGPSNLQYGMDNRIWGSVGYSGFKGEIDGFPFDFRQGFFRFDRNYSNFEKTGNTSNNTWGLGFTEANQVFGSTANNTHSVYSGIPNRYYEKTEGLKNEGTIKIDGHYPMHPVTDKVRQVDVFGGFTAAAGHHFYTARHYPERYWNNYALIAEPTGHLVHQARILPDGAGFKETDGGNLIAGADEWFAPVEAKTGPDGNVWVADWYNFIVQHNPTPTPDHGGYEAENGPGNAYINPLRDREHGRIWKIVPKGKKPEKEPQLSINHPHGLVAALDHSNLFWRLTAQRMLIERNHTDIAVELYHLLSRHETDATGNDPAALHALWTLDGLNVAERGHPEAYDHMTFALDHPAPAVRRAAMQILSKTGRGIKAMKKSKIWEDEDPNAVLEALLVISEWPADDQMGHTLFLMSEDPAVRDDHWLSQALYIASVTHKNGFLKSYIRKNGSYDPQEKEGEEEESSEWIRSFLDHYWDDSVRADEEEEVVFSGEAQKIELGVIVNEMKYDRTTLEVKAGQAIELHFINNDFMQHNVLILAPGSLEKVGEAADRLAMDPAGTEKEYVPDLPEVLFFTKMVDPEETTVLRFIAPEAPGDYPFVCTFPGHWRLMNGVMKVR